MGFTSMRLVLCLSHEPRHIAAACILLAYRLYRQDIPEIDDSSLMMLIEDRFETLDGKRNQSFIKLIDNESNYVYIYPSSYYTRNHAWTYLTTAD